MLNPQKYIFKLLSNKIVGGGHDRIYLRNIEHSVVY